MNKTDVLISVMEGPQAEFVRSEAKFPAMVAGRRAGKTTASVIKMFTYVTRWPGAYGVFTVPTMGDIDRILLPKMHELFGSFKNTLWGHLEKKAQFVFPQHQGTVFLRTASEPDSLRGMSLAFGAMDEVGTENQQEAFNILQPAVLGGQPGYPHQLWTTTTPNVQRKWVQKIWQDKRDPVSDSPLLEPDEYPVFRAKSKDNPYVRAEMEMLIQQAGQSRWAQQEYEGEFIAVEGLALPMLDPSVHYLYPGEDVEFVKTVYGFDYGVTAPTAIVEWKQDRRGRRWATGEFYKRDADEYEWIEWLAERQAKRVICDPSVSDKQITYWATRYGVRMQRARSKTFFDRVNVWATGLECRGRPATIFVTPACPNTWDELINLVYERPRGIEYLTDRWARGTSDHGFDAGSYGLMDFQTYSVKPLSFVRVA